MQGGLLLTTLPSFARARQKSGDLIHCSIARRSCVGDNAACHATASIESSPAGARGRVRNLTGASVKRKDESRAMAVVIHKRDAGARWKLPGRARDRCGRAVSAVGVRPEHVLTDGCTIMLFVILHIHNHCFCAA
jgi:hypothetical protein